MWKTSKPLAQTAQCARVIEEAVERAVDIEAHGVEAYGDEGHARAVLAGVAAYVANKGGLDARHFQLSRMARVKFRAKHFADQVHAGPSLFGVIADHG